MPVIQTLSSLESVGDVFNGGALEGRESNLTAALRLPYVNSLRSLTYLNLIRKR